MTNTFNMREEKPEDVRNLLQTAKQRRQDRVKYDLIAKMINGETVDITKDMRLFEALNRERLDFEQILKLHPEQGAEVVKYVKERKEQQGGRWYNKDSDAWWGEKGAIPPCCYYARPASYWQNKKLTNNFFNQFPKFRIAEHTL